MYIIKGQYNKKYDVTKYKDCVSQSTFKHIAHLFNLDSKLSVKFQYYNARLIANKDKTEDEGSSIEDNLK